METKSTNMEEKAPNMQAEVPEVDSSLAAPENDFLSEQSSEETAEETCPGGSTTVSMPRPRMTAFAFYLQECSQQNEEHPEENDIPLIFQNGSAMRWKIMPPKEKKRFQDMAEEDKRRYNVEMQKCRPEDESSTERGTKRKYIRDPSAPKRPLCAFFWFSRDERDKVKMLNPEYGVGDIAQELSKKWLDVDPETKAKYEAIAKEDGARYTREMTEYNIKMKELPEVGGSADAAKHNSDEDAEEENKAEENAVDLSISVPR